MESKRLRATFSIISLLTIAFMLSFVNEPPVVLERKNSTSLKLAHLNREFVEKAELHIGLSSMYAEGTLYTDILRMYPFAFETYIEDGERKYVYSEYSELHDILEEIIELAQKLD